MTRAVPEVRPSPEQSIPLRVTVYTTLDRSAVVSVKRDYEFAGAPNAWVDTSKSGEWTDIPLVGKLYSNVKDFIRRSVYINGSFYSELLLRRNNTNEVLWHREYECIDYTMLLSCRESESKGLRIDSTFYLTKAMGEVEAVDTEAFAYIHQHEYAEMWNKGMYRKKPVAHEYCADLKGHVYFGAHYPTKIHTNGCSGDLIKCVRNYLDKKPIYTWYDDDATFSFEGDNQSLLMVVVNDGEFYKKCGISSLVGNLNNRSEYHDWFNIYLKLSTRISRELLPAINRCYGTEYKSLHEALNVTVLAPELHKLTMAVLSYYEQ